MKIPFDIKFRPQIESGEYKVETRDGRSVRIICWDRVAKENTDDDLNLCVLVSEYEGESIYYYHRTGEKWVRDEQYDLFIITPDPELSEFEKGCMRIVHKMKPEDFNDDGLKIAKEEAAELLALVRKELCEQIVDHTKEAYDNGKAEALKDLPRWKKWENGACGNGQGIPIAIVKRGLNGYELVDSLGIPGEQYIMLSDLEKLPGFNE